MTSVTDAAETLAAAMRRALDLAAAPERPPSPNPRVGCVILDAAGTVVGEGSHRGAGLPHAEVEALAAAGAAARGGTAVVTLEPCHHVGRTGPCTTALLDAGVARVAFSVADPDPVAAGGADALRSAGVEVVDGVLPDEGELLLEAWLHSVRTGRPFVTWKAATTLDGRIAAADGSSRWITGPVARADVHDLRRSVDAIIVGTGTVIADDPALTARDARGEPAGHQPLRVVMGMREIPDGAAILQGDVPALHLRTRDPAEVLAELQARGVRHALVESGPRVAAAFCRAGLVDRLRWYVAPVLLGSGEPVVGDLGIASIAGALRADDARVTQVGGDARIEARLRPAGASPAPHPRVGSAHTTGQE